MAQEEETVPCASVACAQQEKTTGKSRDTSMVVARNRPSLRTRRVWWGPTDVVEVVSHKGRSRRDRRDELPGKYVECDGCCQRFLRSGGIHNVNETQWFCENCFTHSVIMGTWLPTSLHADAYCDLASSNPRDMAVLTNIATTQHRFFNLEYDDSFADAEPINEGSTESILGPCVLASRVEPQIFDSVSSKKGDGVDASCTRVSIDNVEQGLAFKEEARVGAKVGIEAMPLPCSSTPLGDAICLDSANTHITSAGLPSALGMTDGHKPPESHAQSVRDFVKQAPEFAHDISRHAMATPVAFDAAAEIDRALSLSLRLLIEAQTRCPETGGFSVASAVCSWAPSRAWCCSHRRRSGSRFAQRQSH